MRRSDNPLLSSIQDLIQEKYDLESWPSDLVHRATIDGDWIDVYVFGEESYIFTVGVMEGPKLVIYRPVRDSWGYDNNIDLYNKDFLEELCGQIEETISNITE